MQLDFPIHRLRYGIKLKLKLTCSRSLALALELDARNLDFNYDFALETSYVEGSNVSAEWVLEWLNDKHYNTLCLLTNF